MKKGSIFGFVCSFVISWTIGVHGAAVVESARAIPCVRQVDVLVVGGSSAGVTAAVAAKRAGCDVYLVAPRPYLGEDLAGTLRLALEPGEKPTTELAKEIWLDTNVGLPFTYTTQGKSVKPHVDTGRMLTDGRLTDPVHESVQFNDAKVRFDINLGAPKFVTSVELVSFFRTDDFDVAEARLVSHVGEGKWSKTQRLKRVRTEKDRVFWKVDLNCEVQTMSFAALRTEKFKRMLLGEIRIRTKDEAGGRLRVPTPLQVKQAFDRTLLTNDIAFLTGAYVTDVLRDGKGEVAGVVMANRSGRQAIVAKTIVDATERATVARMAGVPFTPYPSGETTFTRIVISGEKPSGKIARVRELPGDYSVGVQHRRGVRVQGRAWECTLTLPMKDGSYASFAEAEQLARDRTFTTQQLEAADTLFQVPPDRATGTVPHVFVLGGCAGLTAADLRPLAFMDRGTAVGAHAAADARKRGKPTQVSVQKGSMTGETRGTICETLNGLRPYEKGLPTIPSAAQALPVWGDYDVVVVGGGTGGAPAGIGAARQTLESYAEDARGVYALFARTALQQKDGTK